MAKVISDSACLVVLLCSGVGCLDYGLFGKDPDPNTGGRDGGGKHQEGDTDVVPDDTADTGPTGDTDTVPDDTGEPPDTETCDGFAAPSAYSVSTVSTCANSTPLLPISPTLEWSWTTNTVHPGWDNIESNPFVAHLTDDNADGIIGPGDDPDVVFLSQKGDDYWTGNGALTALDGKTGAVHWSIRQADGHRFNAACQHAVGDIDADGQPDVCMPGWTSSVVCVEGDTGAFKWAAGSEISIFGGIVLSDMDGDGFSEVVYGRQIFDHQGNVLGVGTGGYGGIDFYGYPAFASVVADWDGDGTQEVVAGNTVYEMDGSTSWTDGGNDGLVAIVDLDLDGLPDLVRSGDFAITAVLNDGTERWTMATPGGGPGGPPSIADLDNNGQPDILVSDFTQLTALDAAGNLLWAVPIRDTSSGTLGVSTVDLDGDGYLEVVHADEITWRIIDGFTGAVVHEDTGHASSTGGEYPIIADVDADGEAEILLASNNGNFSGWNGLRVFGSGGLGWPMTRQVWNQHSYWVSNVDDDASIPAAPTDSWDLWNDYRSAGLTTHREHWRADLQPGEPELCLDDCDHGVVHIAIPIENEGLVEAGAFEVAVVASDGTRVGQDTVPGLSEGSGVYSAVLEVGIDDWDRLTVEVDSAGAVDECDETDNVLELGDWPCE